jgi:glucose/arabinose dehydrogenase
MARFSDRILRGAAKRGRLLAFFTRPSRCWGSRIAVACTWLAALAASTGSAQSIQAGRLRVEMERLVDRVPASTLDFSVYMDTPHDGTDRLFFAELGGVGPFSPARIRILENGGFSTFLDLTGEAYFTGETGFLGFVFHPGFADPQSPGYRKLYTYVSERVDPDKDVDFEVPGYVPHHQNVLTEWQVDANDPNRVDVSSRREIFRESHIGNIHAGGMLEFGPDGYLYGSIGTPSVNNFAFGQDNSNIFGTIFRIDPVAPALTAASSDPISVNGQYRIPATNPFANDPNALHEIYAYGVRSPYRFSIDPQSGLLFLGDVGQAREEEVDVVHAGDNLGWPYREGTMTGVAAPPNPPPSMIGPIAEYSHADGQAIIGGYVYRGSIPALKGKYIFGELSYGLKDRLDNQGRLLWIDPFDAAGNVKSFSENHIEEILTGPATCASSYNGPGDCTFDAVLTSFAVDDDGELYALGYRDYATVIYKITDAYFLPEGDYNEDGVVDAADYVVWRDSLGSNTDLRANGDDTGTSQGVIDAADYAVWKSHFGETIASNQANAMTVPGPSSLRLIGLLGLMMFPAQRSRWFAPRMDA